MSIEPSIIFGRNMKNNKTTVAEFVGDPAAPEPKGVISPKLKSALIQEQTGGIPVPEHLTDAVFQLACSDGNHVIKAGTGRCYCGAKEETWRDRQPLL